jgi:hypothetical protein
MNRCNAIISFGDDYGDNDCTFHCELEEGHDGKHLETGTIRKRMPYTLTWEGTIVILHLKCPKCNHTEDVEKEIMDFYQENEGGYDCLYCPDGTMMEVLP